MKASRGDHRYCGTPVVDSPISIFTAYSLLHKVRGKTPGGEMQHSLARYATNAMI
jgi:hypothetical protein